VATNFRHVNLSGLAFSELRPVRFLAVVIATAGVYFFSIFDLSFVLNEHLYRLGHGDTGLNFLGFLYFVRDEWRFPLFETGNLGYPYGTNIILTDSTPLLALIFKSLAPVLPKDFDPFGLWILLCYLLIAHAFSALLFHFGHRHMLAAVAGALFAMMTPYFTVLLEIASLEAQFLILYAILLYFRVADTDNPQRALAWFTLLLVAALLINFYFFAMAFTLYCCAAVNMVFRSGARRHLGAYVALTIAVLMGAMFVAGYLPRRVPWTGSSGYGHFSMNLLAPFASNNSHNLKAIRILDLVLKPDATGGQYEGGFNYWGVGIFLLLCASAPVWLRRRRELFNLRLWPLLLGLLGLTAFAVSNEVYFGQYLLLSYQLPATLLSIANQFHSSGRFFWVVSYCVMALAVSQTLRLRPRWLMAALLLCGVVLQFKETQFIRDALQNRTRLVEPQSLTEVRWQPIVAAHRLVALVPPAQCGGFRDIYSEIGRISALSNVALHSVWAGRFGPSAPESCRTLQRDILEHGFSSGVLYLFEPRGFQSIRRRPELEHSCAELEGRYVCTLQRTSLSLPPLPPDPGPAPWPPDKNRLDALGLKPFLGMGWSSVEGTGVWSLGNRSELYFRLSSCMDATGLEVSFVPFAPPEGQKVTVSVNGRAGESRRYRERQPESLILPIQLCDQNDPLVTVSFQVEEAPSPLEVGESGDARPLGVLLLEAELVR